jgi:peptidoglycan/xylan/chitin deacetylase (PgdA/CDA1 family)
MHDREPMVDASLAIDRHPGPSSETSALDGGPMSHAAPAPPGIAILMYHSFASSTTASFRHLTVDPLLFDEHVAALIDAGCHFVAVEDVPALLAGSGAADGRTVVAISIDDGLADAASAVATLLAHRLPATLFVPSGYVGSRARWLTGEDSGRPLLDWAAIEELANAGLEIGSHGHRHLAADVNAPEVVREDAAYSKNVLESRLGREVKSYAYPFGYQTAAARRAVRAAGFLQACAIMDLPAVVSDDPLALPRLHVGPDTTAELLIALVNSRPIRLARRRAEVKQRIWQAGRRWAGWGPREAGVVALEDALGTHPRG